MGQVHLIKLCVGVDSVEELMDYEAHRGPTYPVHTRQTPKRAAELLDGGSLYWVIKGVILCRREIVDIESFEAADSPTGLPLCHIHVSSKPIFTEAMPRRPFQGWRYLNLKDAPRDIRDPRDAGDLPPDMVAALKEAGAW
ncbi:DUF1489 family protein [Asticcacaulis machinosus]|uniref:DUF1489 domain-containing protein n=1 Tax=Asticcacaulis machinosus TaxID=2984211 RepID=A0ABT5HH92_9CAUL|nr:DUF1489 domain-containing protein [Asticcacaulis machinosus]MDC7675615.1 DUF1489 domain-containing protein [Asticcacaulis machinosus]